jgi:hypothetical protein
MTQSTGSARQYESGFIRPVDGVIHAVQKRVTGNVARCGAGRIETLLVGRFDPDAEDACPACRTMLSDGAG